MMPTRYEANFVLYIVCKILYTDFFIIIQKRARVCVCFCVLKQKQFLQIHNTFKSSLTSAIEKFMKTLKQNKKTWLANDYSIYTGIAGIAYLYHQYGKYDNNSAYIQVYFPKSSLQFITVVKSCHTFFFPQTATELLERCCDNYTSRHKITLLTGVVGPLALTAVLLHSQHKEDVAKQLISKYIDFLLLKQ